LGVESYGLYGLIGSILTIFSSFQSLFASSIQRFINVSRNNSPEEINKIFSIGLKIQVWLAILFFVGVDIVGLITIPHLNIPAESVIPSYWILQMTLFTSVATIITVPYNAMIIAYEKFTAYAVLSIIESILKLIVVILLLWNPFNRVVYYSLLMLILSLIMRSLNYLYCRSNFGEIVTYISYKDKPLMKKMMQFAGWQFIGSTGYSLSMTGINFVLNIFGGLVVNAARSISNQVHGFISPFIGELNTGFRPRCMMLYKEGLMKEFYDLFYLSTRMNYLVTSLVTFPFIIMAPQILRLWLGDIPEYSVEFVRAILLFSLLRSVIGPIDTLFMASGKIAAYHIVNIFTMSLSLPISCLGLYLGMPYYGAILMLSVSNVLQIISILILAKYQLGIELMLYVRNVLARLLISLLFLFLFYNYFVGSSMFHSMTPTAIFRGGMVTLTYVFVIDFFLILSHSERLKIVYYILQFYRKL
jgi:O-antigen/teichoic acid export membrane protein